MPDAFDPYFKWLGIPKADQPPHGYRLLGIELFESDADVISNAADGRMAQIKSFQSGKFAAVSQKLLNEIAAAKVCLLNPQKKAEYDRRLRAHLQQKSAAADAKAEGRESRQPRKSRREIPSPAFRFSIIQPRRSSLRPARPRNRNRNSRLGSFPRRPASERSRLWLRSLPISLRATARTSRPIHKPQSLAGSNHKTQPNQSAKSTDKPAAGKRRADPKPTGAASTAATEKTHVPASLPSAAPAARADSETRNQAKTENRISGRARETTRPEQPSPAVPLPKRERKTLRKPSPPAPLPEGEGSQKKPPIPDKQQCQAMKSKILKVFQKEFAEAKTPESKLALAVKLDEQGDASKDDPVERYSLWRIAADGASAAGDFSRAMEIVDKIQAQFDVDGDAMKAEILGTGALAPR